MRVRVVSDIHGNVEGLRRVALAADADALIVLGDLLDYIDYHEPSGGILGAIFGGERVAELIRFRAAGDFGAYHAYDRELWSSVGDPAAALDEVVREKYQELISALGPSTYLTLGNVDVRETWDDVAPSHLRCLDGTSVEVGGRLLGFVGGGSVRDLPTGSPWKSFDRHPDVFSSTLDTVGAVDVLCTHVPPKLDDLRYDTMTRRTEMYGPGILEYVDTHRPSLSLFGHIHHPRAAEFKRGATTFRNVGYFKRDPVGVLVDLDTLNIVAD